MSPRVGLDRTAVVEAAAILADEVGFEGVTLARLAGRLSVRTPSLYNHVDGLDGLRRELALLGTRELGFRIGRAAVGKSADKAVVAIAHAYRAFVKERPGLYAATVRSYRLSDPTDSELQALEREIIGVVLDVFASYGLRGDDALHAVRGLRSVVHGFATLESAGGFGMPLEVDESFERLLRIFVDGVRRKVAPKK
jgi:AcrR family transcriptional regulator